jgi:uncharacterized protein
MRSIVLYFVGFLLVMAGLTFVAAFLAAMIRSRFTAAFITRRMLRYKGLQGSAIASAIGLVTPFCSCTTVPIFAGLLGGNVSLGVATSFLIASPSMNLTAFLLLVYLFGIRAASGYLLSCYLIAIFGGYIVGRFGSPDQLKRSFVEQIDECCIVRWQDAIPVARSSLVRFLPILAVAAAVGALMHNLVPQELISRLSRSSGVLGVPIAVAVGGPLYADVVVLLPIGFALLQKGLNQGIVFAFLISAAGISIPSILLLSRILRMRLLVFLVSLLLVFYTLIGIVFYYLPGI